MKKLLLVLFLMPSLAFAAGPYDGIWQSSNTGYTIVNQNGNRIIATSISLSDGRFTIFGGEIEGSTLSLGSIIGDATSEMNIVFESPTKATAQVVSCVPNPGFICLFSPGLTIVFNKVF